MFTLAISCLTTSNLPWFMDLTFKVPMQYCSLQHQTLFSPPDTYTTGHCFCFGSASSFLVELFLHSSPVAYWAPTKQGSSSFSVISFCLFILCSWILDASWTVKQLIFRRIQGFVVVQLLSHIWLFVTPWTVSRQASCPSPTPGAYSNSCSSIGWCHPTISASVIPFSSCPQYFPASGSFPICQFFASCGQSIGVSASVLPMTIQDWFLLALTSLISLQSKGLSRVFSNSTVQKHQFFGAQLSSQSNSHTYTWPQEKP